MSYRKAKRVVDRLQMKALDLAFKEVSEIVELSGDVCNSNHFKSDSDLHGLISSGEMSVVIGDQFHRILPEKIIGFSAWAGHGCEPAQIALGIYPATISVLGKAVRTGIRGWCWRSFCQTLSASEYEFGGVGNYVRCHLTVTKLLDYASEIGVLRDVFDETGFWIDRNLEALGESPAKWNEQVERMAEDMRRLMEDE